jgi:hypothetical protein
MILARVASLMPGRECSARSTVPMETPTVSAISLIPADFASADPALERVDLRACPSGSLRLSFEDFTGDIDWPFCAALLSRELPRNRIKFTAGMRSQLDCQG